MNRTNLTERDIQFLEEQGIGLEAAESQIGRLTRGNIPVSLLRPAGTDDGILRLSKERKEELTERYDSQKGEFTIIKFVPASGAASRMFSDRQSLLAKIRELPFADDLNRQIEKDGATLDTLISENNSDTILEYLLTDRGLNYGAVPKGLVKFHKYQDRTVCPVAEHFAEAVRYTGEGEDTYPLHFTIPESFRTEFLGQTSILEKLFLEKGYRIRSEFSFQDKSTDTLSIDGNGKPVRDKRGNLYLRAGGHGSLIRNLNTVNSDIIFIKNIDNITTVDRLHDTVTYKKALGGLLMEIQDKVFTSIRTIPRIIKDGESINEIYCFSKDVLNISFPSNFIEFELEKKKQVLTEKLNRPIRICGMVPNTNEPGGGPFWIRDTRGAETLQIIEESQIDKKSEEQVEIYGESSHFNPTDIVCSIHNHRGDRFQLDDFVEESRYFVSRKKYENREIRVLEHPGLWNGSMEKWISLYVEVPLSTFNPVKYANDLLRENHIPSVNTPFSSLI